MTDAQKVSFFLEEDLRRSAEQGDHNFLRLISEVLAEAGLRAEYRSMQERHVAQGLSITHMKPPASKQGLVFRRVYHYPFWQIEQTDKRWNWDVARASFDPKPIANQEARRFRNFWRKRLFGDVGPAHGDAIYIPLQGKISRHRSFQSCAPIDMVASVLQATDRPVIITLHPKETYTPSEVKQLQSLIASHTNASLDTGGMDRYLPNCHCVVTQNSSAAFNGYFLNKPVVLFSQIDFHHIASSATPTNVSDALASPAPSDDVFAKYLWWFWQDQSINAGRPEAKQKIRARLARFGWPI